MPRAAILALLLGGCSLLTNVDELSFDAGAGPFTDGGPMLADLDSGVDAGPNVSLDAGPDADAGGCAPRLDVDLLIVNDESQSLATEREALAEALPVFFRRLVMGDATGDGLADFTPLSSLHVGVVTSDMGTGGYSVPSCSERMFGDDGVLVTEPRATSACEARGFAGFIDYAPPGGLSELESDVDCLTQRETAACGFEQPLEAMLKALSPSTSSVRFFDNTVGHGDGVNAGFLRDSSVLVVLLLTDEDDCSASDPELFDFGSTRYTTDLNLRCVSHPDALYPLSRYATGLSELRPDGAIVFVPVVGLPPDLVGSSLDVALADPRMQVTISGSTVEPACAGAGGGTGEPGRRFVGLAAELERDRAEGGGVEPVVGSICEESFVGLVGRVLAAIARNAPGCGP